MEWLAGPRNYLVPAALAVACATPIYFAVAALGTRFGLWDWTVGLGLLTIKIGPILLIVGAVLGVLALLASLLASPGGGRIAAIIALAIPVAGLVMAGQVRSSAMKVPPIHDISTDLANPPAFSQAVMTERGDTSNPIAPAGFVFPQDEALGPLKGRALADVQAEAYPDVTTIRLEVSVARAFQVSITAARRAGITITRSSAEPAIIEGVAQSFWFGFKDDVVIRITPDGVGAAIDVRSVSRVGISDLGANAKRIRAFRDELLKIV